MHWNKVTEKIRCKKKQCIEVVCVCEAKKTGIKVSFAGWRKIESKWKNKMILNGSLLSNSIQVPNRSSLTTSASTSTSNAAQHVRLVQLVLDATKVRKVVAVSAAANSAIVSPSTDNGISTGKFLVKIWFF